MRLSRTGFATWSLALTSLVLRLPHVPTTLDQLSSPSFPMALGALIELALLAVATWTSLALGACALGGGAARAAGGLVPRALRGILLAGVVTGFGISTAHAGVDHPGPDRQTTDQGAVHRSDTGHRTTGVGLDGLSLPDRPVLVASVEPSAPPPQEREIVLVAPGDTLWSIAARSLGPSAHDGEIADAARRWYLENLEVIGSDPDLIRPGQRLVAPGGAA